ncbi:MAG: OsmC family protein, partial [Candidatus Bathyarchaeia archaeon]
ATIFTLMAKKMRVTLKDLEVKLEALKTEEAGTVTEANFNITVKTDASEETINRIFKLTVENCPVGKIFEKAGVKIAYNVKTEK